MGCRGRDRARAVATEAFCQGLEKGDREVGNQIFVINLSDPLPIFKLDDVVLCVLSVELKEFFI